METVSIGGCLLEFIGLKDEVCVLGSVLGVELGDLLLAFIVLLLSFG